MHQFLRGHSEMHGVCTVILAFFSMALFAQQPAAKGPAGTNPGEIKIERQKMTNLGKDTYQRVRGVTGGASAKAREWGVFDVVYRLNTAPLWVDEVIVTYTVMLRQNGNADEKAGLQDPKQDVSLLRLSVAYANLDGDRQVEHRAGVIVEPDVLARYGRAIGFAVQISIGGKEVASEGFGDDILRGREKWWLDPKIIDSPIVVKRDGLLLDRTKTPFALMDIDSYDRSVAE